MSEPISNTKIDRRKNRTRQPPEYYREKQREYYKNNREHCINKSTAYAQRTRDVQKAIVEDNIEKAIELAKNKPKVGRPKRAVPLTKEELKLKNRLAQRAFKAREKERKLQEQQIDVI